MRALTGIKKWFPGILPKALQTLKKCVNVQENYFEGNIMQIGGRLLVSA
jgi:hypothetical protein